MVCIFVSQCTLLSFLIYTFASLDSRELKPVDQVEGIGGFAIPDFAMFMFSFFKLLPEFGLEIRYEGGIFSGTIRHLCPGSFPVMNILKMKANSWPCVQANRAKKEEEIATHEPPELCIMPILMDSGESQSENSVKPHDVYCYERLRDQITELFRALKSTFDGNEMLVKALVENPSLDLLQQCDQLIDGEINECYDRAIAKYQERMSNFMHGDGAISTP